VQPDLDELSAGITGKKRFEKYLFICLYNLACQQ
jgi:hypothetical protein